MIAININPILKKYLISIGYKNIEIYPINGYSDTRAPFITWLEFPAVQSSEAYWMQQSILTYSVFDNDLSRAKDISVAIQKFLNLGDDIENLKSLIVDPSPDFRICWIRFSSGGMFPPQEREGFASITRSFNVGYVEV